VIILEYNVYFFIPVTIFNARSRMDNPEKTEGAIKNGQSRENRRGNQEWTIQRKQKGQSRMDNPEKTEGLSHSELFEESLETLLNNKRPSCMFGFYLRKHFQFSFLWIVHS
jgi:hypothetical protein